MKAVHRRDVCLRAIPAALWLFAAALATGAGLPDAKVQEIERAVAEEMDRQGIPGLSLAVSSDLRLAWSAGFGMADLENSVPARAATVYRLASISKPITAIAVLQLVERALIDLDAPIQTYVPSFPEKQWPVTIRNLLRHTAGIRHYKGLEEVNSTRHYRGLQDPLAIFQADPLLFEPGTRFAYTTYGYNLLGAAVQGASGVPFIEYLRANIFEPAGMDRIQPDDVHAIIPNRARGYRTAKAGGVENCALADTSNKIPGGGMVSTPEDLVKLAIALGRGKLLKKETLGQMYAQQRTRSGDAVPYGLGWFVREAEGTKWVSHSGGQQGVSTNLMTLPREGCAVAIMTNLEGASVAPLSARIAAILLK
jgi:CubicO group peptidase (beta-lactamase class C family)